ncbi:MAG TPA: hypothetical protein VFS02_02880, partial [Telluria sp.]|nr:hypothetical protein [Telluria sp.]
ERASVALKAADYELKIKEKVAASADIVAVKNAAGREQAHRIGMDLLKLRTGITAAGEAARQDATAFSKAVIARERELVALISPEEKRVIALRDAWDEKIAAEKAAKIAAAKARVDAIQADIDGIVDRTIGLDGAKSAVIKAAIDSLDEIVVSEERFAEFTEAAAKAIGNCKARMAALLVGAEVAEAAALAAEEARKAEAARLEAERAELDRQRAENERIANEQAATARKLAEQQAAQAAEQRRIAEQAAANLKAEREAQETAMRLEREKQAEAQRKAADEIRIARESLEAAQAAHNAAILAQQEAAQRDAAHAEALADNATFDAAMQRLAEVETPTFTQPADLARCNAMVATARADKMAESVEAYEAGGLADESEAPAIDYEAIAWAYQKLIAFGVGNGSMDNAMMLDRLNLMLLTAP